MNERNLTGTFLKYVSYFTKRKGIKKEDSFIVAYLALGKLASTVLKLPNYSPHAFSALHFISSKVFNWFDNMNGWYKKK